MGHASDGDSQDTSDEGRLTAVSTMDTIKAFGGKFVTRAPKGGFDHPVNGKHYKGGRFCPLYAVAGGSEEAQPADTRPTNFNLRGEVVTDLGDGPFGVIYEIMYCHDNARIFSRPGRPASLQDRAVALKEHARDAWKRFRAACPADEQPRRIGAIYHREAAEGGL